MSALGASEDDRRDRGNYAPNSQVMNTTYDYATGLGPLAANSLVGGRAMLWSYSQLSASEGPGSGRG